jgi:SAM-dependent methyltransferase
VNSAAAWHEVECGGYAADLAVWERLADGAEGAVLELGCGSGRVALHLARRGHEVWAVDADPALLEVLESRGSTEGLAVSAHLADVRSLELDHEFGLAIAPMQVMQMLGGEGSRYAALERTAGHLAAGGRLAAAIVERPAGSVEGVGAAAIPDVRELDGWLYSSLAVGVSEDGGGLEVHRLRQAVSPGGALREEAHIDRLENLDADTLELEGTRAGLEPAGRLEVPATAGYLGSTVVVMEAA